MPRIRSALALLAVWSGVGAASGDFWQNFYRGLEIYATPSGSPVTGVAGGGLSNGERFGRVRIVPNEFADGYRLELDRNFGGDVTGRPEVFDFGNQSLELRGNTGATVEFTRRGIPALTADVGISSLDYILRFNNGLQDFEVAGEFNYNQRMRVNRYGFYTLDLSVVNEEASVTADGVIVDGELFSDFEVGPIRIKGNVFFDVAVAALASFGVPTEGIEGIFPASPIDMITDEIRSTLNAQTAVLGEKVVALTLEDPRLVGPVVSGIVLPHSMTVQAANGAAVAFGAPQFVPEPSALTLLALGAGVLLRRR